MKAKQATIHPELVTQLEIHACSCPPTMHDTKLDQLNKARVEVKASIAKAKPVPSHKASTFLSPMSGLAPIKQQYCKQVLIVRAKVDHAIWRQTSKLQSSSLTQRSFQHQHVSNELHKEIFAHATNTKRT
jgi:hypothetical protein